LGLLETTGPAHRPGLASISLNITTIIRRY
jgi:hypothetical protein